MQCTELIEGGSNSTACWGDGGGGRIVNSMIAKTLKYIIIFFLPSSFSSFVFVSGGTARQKDRAHHCLFAPGFCSRVERSLVFVEDIKIATCHMDFPVAVFFCQRTTFTVYFRYC